MKTTYIAFLILIAACLGLWHSIDELSNTTLLIEENGKFYRDNYTTAKRFLSLWPVSMIGGFISMVVIGITVLFTFEASKHLDVKKLKTQLKSEITHYDNLKEQCLSDVEIANRLAFSALNDARIQTRLEVEQERAEIEAKKRLISKKETELNALYKEVKIKSDKIENTLTENNKLVEHYKREVRLAKQKTKNHGNAISKKNNILNRLKTDTEYLKSFIEKNYEK